MKQLNLTLVFLTFFSLMLNSQTYINEISMPSSATDQYIELRGTPSSTIASGTYLVFLGAYSNSAGRAVHIFDLSGYTFGSNGFLVLLQSGNSYTVDASASSYTATGSRWGDLDSGTDDNINDPSWSALLISSATTPTFNTDYDSNNDGVLQGNAASWTVIDAIGYSNSVQDPDTNVLYGGKAYFLSTGGDNGPTIAIGGTTISTSNINTQYVGRIGNSTGETGNDWVEGDTSGTIPSMNFTSNTNNVTPSSYAGQSINTLGSENLDLTLSVDDVSLSSSKLYPIPVKDVLTIQLTSGDELKGYKVIDVNGKEMNLPEPVMGQSTLDIDLSTLSAGMYVLNIKTDKGVITKKFIKS